MTKNVQLPQQTEEWRFIKDSKYQISSLGRAKGPHGRILKPQILVISPWRSYMGYGIKLTTEVKGKTRYAHRLVAEAFLSEIPYRWQVNHINNDPMDNRVVNLEICTIRDNAIHGSWIKGSRDTIGIVSIVNGQYKGVIRRNNELDLTLGSFSTYESASAAINEWMNDKGIHFKLWHYRTNADIPRRKRRSAQYLEQFQEGFQWS